MRKVLMVALAILLVGSGILANGIMAPQALAQTEVKPLEVEVVSVEPLYASGDKMPVIATFILHNPNNIEVTLDTLDYSLRVGDVILTQGQIREDVYIPAESEVEVKATIPVDLVFGPVGYYLLESQGNLAVALKEGLSIWKQMGGTPAGAVALVNDMLPTMLPETLGATLAKFGIPEGITHSLTMMVVMPLVAGLLPKVVDKLVDEIWALGAEPPPTYKVEGTATMIAEGKMSFTSFSQTCEGGVPPPPAPLPI